MEAQAKNWVSDIGRQLLVGIDMSIYKLIRFVIHGIFDLANLTGSSEMVNGIYMRIYVLLGVFMVFKLSFSFFTYIIDPESMTSGKEKGAGKLIANTLVMLVMLISVPTILFGGVNGRQGLIVRAQTALLPMLPRILLGIESGTGVSSGEEGAVAQAADSMASAALSPFFSPAENISELCSEYASVKVPQITSLDDFQKYSLLSCNHTSGVLGTGLWASQYYVYHYSVGLSTVVGVIILVILAAITIDVGKRVFKMLILQMIAPVPIMSYIDPKSSKDGAFAAWVKNLISTFLDLFIKLGLVYLILMFIEAIVINKTMFDNFPAMTNARAYYLILILIIALLMFAKDAPKFIKDSLGIKGKDGGNSMLGKLGGLASGALAGGAAGLMSGRWSGALTGAAAGASAGANAAGSGKPSGAFRAGGNAALQAKTGDSKAQSGLLNNLARRASDAQMRGMAQKYGVTEEKANELKKKYFAANDAAAEAERNAAAVLSDPNATAEQKAYANRVATAKRTSAAKAKSTYDETAQYAKTYRSTPNDYETLRSGSYKAHPSQPNITYSEAEFRRGQMAKGNVSAGFESYSPGGMSSEEAAADRGISYAAESANTNISNNNLNLDRPEGAEAQRAYFDDRNAILENELGNPGLSANDRVQIETEIKANRDMRDRL